MNGEEGIGGRTSPTPGGYLAAGDYVGFGSPDPPALHLPPPLPPPVAEDVPISRSWRREEGAEDDAIEVLDCGGDEKSLEDKIADDSEENIPVCLNAADDEAKIREDGVDYAPRANGISKQAAFGEHEHTTEGCATECLFCTVACCDYCVIM